MSNTVSNSIFKSKPAKVKNNTNTVSNSTYFTGKIDVSKFHSQKEIDDRLDSETKDLLNTIKEDLFNRKIYRGACPYTGKVIDKINDAIYHLDMRIKENQNNNGV